VASVTRGCSVEGDFQPVNDLDQLPPVGSDRPFHEDTARDRTPHSVAIGRSFARRVTQTGRDRHPAVGMGLDI
jgi:hypothetical protein